MRDQVWQLLGMVIAGALSIGSAAQAGRVAGPVDRAVSVWTTGDWDYSNGTARRYIVGTATTGDGRHAVVIDTINGNVTVRTGSGAGQ